MKHSNFNFEKIKISQNNIILFGSVGSGKTSLLNKLCMQSFQTASSGFSCTRDIQFSTTITNSNLIIDFPGLNAAEEVVKHLTVQKETLKAIPFRMICLVIKFTARYDDIVKSCLQMIKIFYSYIKNVALIITHSENTNVTIQSEIEHIFKTKYKIQNIIFTSLVSKPIELSDRLNQMKEKMENIKEAIVRTKDLYGTVDAEFDPDVMEIRENYTKKFLQGLKAFEENFSKSSDKELKRALYFSMKDWKDILVEEYSEKIKDKKIDQDSIITELIMFQNQIFQDFDNFRKMAQKELEIQSINFQGELNRYKKCNYCGLIWFRIYGCASMQCGKRSISKDKLFGKFSKYTIRFLNGRLQIDRKDEEYNYQFKEDKAFYGLLEEEKVKNQKDGKKITPQGCGNQLDWNQLEDVTDLVLRDYLRVIEVTDFDHKVDEIKDKLAKLG